MFFGVGYRRIREYFTPIETSQLLGEGLHILTFARHSRFWSSEGSLACLTYCDTGHPL